MLYISRLADGDLSHPGQGTTHFNKSNCACDRHGRNRSNGGRAQRRLAQSYRSGARGGTALLYALYLPAIASAQKGVPAITATFYLVAGVAASFLIAGVATGELGLPQTPALWGYVVLLAVLCTVMAFGALLAGLRTLGPVRTGIVATIEPFFTTLLGAVFLSDQLGPEVLAGGAMIAGAVILL
ncbi:MAG: DMT family transporter [Gemmatimonadaceae bacterium]